MPKDKDTEVTIPATQPGEDAKKIVDDVKKETEAATEPEASAEAEPAAEPAAEPTAEPEAPVEGSDAIDTPSREAASIHMPPAEMMDYVEVKHPFDFAADEFQAWLDRGETPDGSRCDMAALTPVIAWLRHLPNQVAFTQTDTEMPVDQVE